MNNKLKSIELFLALGTVTAVAISSNITVNAEETNQSPAHTHL